jgi:hypothetical protein
MRLSWSSHGRSVGAAIGCCLAASLIVGCPSPRDFAHYRSGQGLRRLQSYVQLLQLTEPEWRSFTRLYEYVRQQTPESVAAMDMENPFPGLLPGGRRYARVLYLPAGLSRSEVPLMWDTTPDPGGYVAVLFWNGTVSSAGEVTEGALASLLTKLKEGNAGVPLQISSGGCARARQAVTGWGRGGVDGEGPAGGHSKPEGGRRMR